MRHEPLFETRIAGIPCGVVVETYQPAQVWRQHRFAGAGPGDCEPPVDDDLSWFLVNLRHYRIDWLVNKLSESEKADVEDEIRQEIQRIQRGAA